MTGSVSAPALSRHGGAARLALLIHLVGLCLTLLETAYLLSLSGWSVEYVWFVLVHTAPIASFALVGGALLLWRGRAWPVGLPSRTAFVLLAWRAGEVLFATAFWLLVIWNPWRDQGAGNEALHCVWGLLLPGPRNLLVDVLPVMLAGFGAVTDRTLPARMGAGALGVAALAMLAVAQSVFVVLFFLGLRDFAVPYGC